MRATIKKVLTMLLVVSLVAGFSVAGTMAYLTQDVGDEKNVFTVGNIDIDLSEEVGVYGEGGEVKETDDGAEYTGIMPGDYLQKEVTVTNNGKTPAYVAVTVTMNNALEINRAIDQYYEGQEYTAEQIQAMYDLIFDGWGINYNPRPGAYGVDDARGVIDGTYDLPEHVLHVDFAKTTDFDNDTTMFSVKNWFMSEKEKAAADKGDRSAWLPGGGYYTSKLVDNAETPEDERDYTIVYTYYIYLEAGESTTLFKGLNVPAEFDAAQLAMFDGLEINVEAKAIQADNMGIAKKYVDDENGKAKTAFEVLAGTIKAANLEVNNAPETVSVNTLDALKEAIAAAEDGDTIRLTADIDTGTSYAVKLDGKITLDLGGKTLSSSNVNNAVQLYNGASLKNGTVKHNGTVAGIKVWGADSIENVDVVLSGKSGKDNAITGIVVQEGNCYIKSLKNVTVTGTGENKVYNGIETYRCGNRTDNAIGSMTNVKVDVNGTALILSAPAGTATDCSFKGGVYGINAHLKGAYNVSLNLVKCEVSGGTYGIYAHDEAEYTNPGYLELTGANTTVTGGVKQEVNEEFGTRWSVTGLN